MHDRKSSEETESNAQLVLVETMRRIGPIIRGNSKLVTVPLKALQSTDTRLQVWMKLAMAAVLGSDEEC